MLFSPNSALCSKNYPRNINYMSAIFSEFSQTVRYFFASLDFGKNCYSRTASYGVGTKSSISGIFVESFALAPTNELTQRKISFL